MPDEKGNSPAQDILGRIGDPRGDALLNPDKPRDNVTVAERVYLTEDGRAVKGDDSEASILLVAEGGLLPRALAEELGLTDTAPAANNTVPDNLEKLKKDELVAIAVDQGIDGAESMKKADLVAAIATPAAEQNAAPVTAAEQSASPAPIQADA